MYTMYRTFLFVLNGINRHSTFHVCARACIVLVRSQTIPGCALIYFYGIT